MRLFVYGELCKPAVLRGLLGRVPTAEPALLAGYRRSLNRATGYFRAVPSSGGRIAGLLLEGIDERDLAELDGFENVDGGEYRRVEVEVEALADGGVLRAWAYVAG